MLFIQEFSNWQFKHVQLFSYTVNHEIIIFRYVGSSALCFSFLSVNHYKYQQFSVYFLFYWASLIQSKSISLYDIPTLVFWQCVHLILHLLICIPLPWLLLNINFWRLEWNVNPLKKEQNPKVVEVSDFFAVINRKNSNIFVNAISS